MTVKINPPVQRAETAEHYSHEDFMSLAPEDRKAELIDGELLMPPPPFYEHERLQGFLFTILQMYVSKNNLGEVLGSRTPVYVAENQTYEPDILFITKERRNIITRKIIIEAPDLVVEILSAATARYDRGVKLGNYEKAGVREIWLIDPYGPAGTQFYQRQEEKLVEVAPMEDVIHSITLPGFKLEMKWLWPDENGEMANLYKVLKDLGVL